MKFKALAVLAMLAVSNVQTSNADSSKTYTVEPFDYDGVFGIVMNVTQLQFGSRFCPCIKIPYPADGLHEQEGSDNIAKVPFKSGDTLMGFSLGVQTISLFLSQHTLPAGVRVLLAGDTYAENLRYGANGIPLNIANQVTMVVNEYDGWSDSPDLISDPNYFTAEMNAIAGSQKLHYYANADINNPANVVTQHGNIKTILIPTQKVPLGVSRSIDSAYSRAKPTTAQSAAATIEQVPEPNPAWPNKPEPAASLG